MTRLEGILIAAAIVGFSLLNVVRANAHQYNEYLCRDRPFICLLPQQQVVTETVRHPVIRPLKPARVGAPSRHDLVPQLAAKVQEIIVSCGSRLISGYRPHAVVAGTRRASLHSRYPSEAADISGNPACIYALLRNWPGGVSTDYGRVHHVHFSYEPHGREWGCRFVHGGHRRYVKHYHRRAA